MKSTKSTCSLKLTAEFDAEKCNNQNKFRHGLFLKTGKLTDLINLTFTVTGMEVSLLNSCGYVTLLMYLCSSFALEVDIVNKGKWE